MLATVIILALLALLVATDPEAREADSSESPRVARRKISSCAMPLLPARLYHAESREFSVGRSVVAVVVSAGLFLSGCTTLQSVPVPIPSGPAVAVQVGNHVEVQTKSGQTLTFQVTQIEPAALVGKDIRVKYDDIAGLQVKRVDKVRTASLTIGIIAGVVLVAGAVVLLAGLSPGLPGP